MQITRNDLATNPGPSDWFTGSVLVDTVVGPATASSSCPARTIGTAPPTRSMTHIAMQQADEDGNVVAWGQHVTDDEYGKAPAIDGGRRKP